MTLSHDEETANLRKFTESIDNIIQESMKLISNPNNVFAQILIDSHDTPSLSKTKLSEYMNELARSTGYRKYVNLTTLSNQLLTLGIVKHRNFNGLGKKSQSFLELIHKDEFSLSLPYFILEKSAEMTLPLENIIGKLGTKKNTLGHLNKMKYFVSFYLAENYPSSSLNNTPKKMNRAQIHDLTDIHPVTLKRIDSKLIEEGLIEVKKIDEQRIYIVLKDFNEYITRHEGFGEKLKKLQDSNRFKVNTEVYMGDFKEALETEKPNKLISVLKKKGYIASQRQFQRVYALTEQGKEIAENIFIPIYKAIVNRKVGPIIRSRERYFSNPEELMITYLNRIS